MSEKKVCSFFVGSKLFKERGTRSRHDVEDRKLKEESKISGSIELKNKTVDNATINKNNFKTLVSVASEQTELKTSDFEQVDFDEKKYIDHLLAGYKEIKIETGDSLNSSNEHLNLNVYATESQKSNTGREDNSNILKRKRPTKRSKNTLVKKDNKNYDDSTANELQGDHIKCKVVSKRKRKLGRPPKRWKDTPVDTEIAESNGTHSSATELQENGFELKVELGKGSKRKRKRPTKRCKDVSIKKRTYIEDISNIEDESSDAKMHSSNEPLKKRERNILCTICGKRLASIYSLKRHAPIHEKPNLRCNVCGRKCIDERRYEVHMASHTGGKPYSCETCGGCFTSAAYLRIHRRIHTGDKPYFCEYCGKSFRGNPSLQAHLAVHSGLKKHSCEICDKQFYKKSALRRHMLCHTGEKHFQCDVCGKYYRQNCALTVHKLIHTGEKNFPCSVCGTRFTQNSSVKVHMKIHLRGAAKSEDKVPKDAIL